MALLRSVSRERRLEVHRLISEGSDPRPTFFLMVGISTLIAGIGLIMNSTAVVIGAMLVAPLMTPILGLSLALVRGDPKLFTLSLRAEIIGVGVALIASTVLGFSIPYFDTTSEMLSRTQPNLFDLTVAVLAGAAGAWAMVDERLSPGLPGVAISTAIVPPLANVGLCISLGSYSGAAGSFLLFFTNFLSILLISSLVFYWGRMGGDLGLPNRMAIARRFGLAVAGFVVIGVALGGELLQMIESRRLRWEIRGVLQNELAALRVSEINRLVHRVEDGKVVVLAQVDSPIVPTPRQVRIVEQRLERELGEPVELFLQSTLTREVSSSGTVNLIRTLDGFSTVEEPDADVSVLGSAEQVIREYLDDRFAFKLEGISAFPWGDGVGLYAEVAGVRRLRNAEIAELERQIQERVGEQRIQLAIRHQNAELISGSGSVRIEMAMRRYPTTEEGEIIRELEATTKSTIEEMGYALVGRSVVILDETYHALFEVVGPRLFSPDELRGLKEELVRDLEIQLELFVRSVPEAVVSEEGYTTMEQLLGTYGPLTRKAYQQDMMEIIREWR